LLVVLADDFSGASEIAGIAHRYGLTTEVHLRFDPESKADLIVLDTNTRSLREKEAIHRTNEIISDLRQSGHTIKLFKKVDSVFRGHIVAEINTLHHQFDFRRVLLLPANPERGRKIIKGNYFINEVSLDKTVFGADPDFPIQSASVKVLIEKEQPILKHVHISRNSPLPEASLITADIETKDDLKFYINGTSENDLCCGGASCFEAFLENLGYADKKIKDHGSIATLAQYALIINGSTVKHQPEQDLFTKLGIPKISLPGEWKGDRFNLPESEEQRWHEEVVSVLHKNRITSVTIDHPVKHKNAPSDIFSGYFVSLVRYISGQINSKPIHLCLTGGATASAIIRSMGEGRFAVTGEQAAGVVTLSRNNGADGLITVKPGSYFWPESFIKNLSVVSKAQH
jgi:uncharacterized protein YgbK (DUF1537 family)